MRDQVLGNQSQPLFAAHQCFNRGPFLFETFLVDLGFVLGQRIQLSKNHPKKDICDKLAGDYPKDFVFDGWHVQCFCFATPILIDEDETELAVRVLHTAYGLDAA